MWCQTSQVDSNVEQLWLYDTEIYIWIWTDDNQINIKIM
jgi:hypothetical protein